MAGTDFRKREPVVAAGQAEADRRLDRLCIDTIRTLAMDAVQKAKSGHPGTPMALAPVAYTLWQRVLRYDCADPQWPNRDRFVLSNGHASMLLYALLHLARVRDRQDEAYRQSVLPQRVKARVSVEAGSTCGWERYVGIGGAMVGMHSFGASAPLKDVMKAFGFTAEHVVEAAKAQIPKGKKS